MRSPNSQGCLREDNTKALEELHRRHPSHQLPEWTDPLTAPLCPDSDFVLETLKKFPRASSPGYSKLCPQQLLDAIVGTTAPSAQNCLESLTRCISVVFVVLLFDQSYLLFSFPISKLELEFLGFRSCHTYPQLLHQY